MLWALVLATLAQPAFGATTQVKLLLDADSARPGETVMAAIQLKMEPKWHTYWANPGDSGDSTKVNWVLPDGIKAGWIQWPVPEKLKTFDLITYVYHDEAVLLVPLTIASNQPPGPVEIKANVAWFECEELCVTGKDTVSAKLVIGPERKPSQQAETIAKARKKLPVENAPLDAKAYWEKLLPGEERFLILDWRPVGNATGPVDFYPYPSDGYEIAGATETISAPAGRMRLRKSVKRLDGSWTDQQRYASGVLMHGGVAYDVGPLIGSLQEDSSGILRLLAELGAAFAGGLLLNIMPCVLPVLALKIFSFVQQSKEDPKRVRLMGSVYGIGVLVSFAILATVAIAAQKAGGLASWGMLLQNPVARIILTIVMTLVALNLFGLFEITPSGRVMGAAGDLANREGFSGAFFNGVLATILATPCTAPFLATALIYAFTASPLTIFLIFISAGLGLAAPFVVLSWNPAWLKVLPKPGLWMEKFKIAMGFPMLATAVWLFWFTSSRMGHGGALWLGFLLVFVAAAAWVWGEFVQRGTRRRALGMAVTVALLAIGYVTFALGTKPDKIEWKPWSPDAVATARSAGLPVLVDFTADNCANCKFNKLFSIEISSVRAKIKDIGALALVADFSDGDRQIAAELRRYNRPGVPLVLVYPRDPNAPAIVLPPVLSPGIVLDALEKANEPPKVSSQISQSQPPGQHN